MRKSKSRVKSPRPLKKSLVGCILFGIIVVTLTVILAKLFIVDKANEHFFNIDSDLVSDLVPFKSSQLMALDPEKRALLTSAMLSDPLVNNKYNDKHFFDIYVAGQPTRNWKNLYSRHITNTADVALDTLLGFKRMILLFDQKDMVGRTVLVPIEANAEFPFEIKDDTFYKKYIIWMPPSNVISALLPYGYILIIQLNNGREIILTESVNPSIIITAPISRIKVDYKENKIEPLENVRIT